MRRPLRRASAAAAAAVLALTGCGGSEDGGEAGASAGQEGEAVEVAVEVENGQVTPSGARVDAQVGQTVRFVVDSDAADELHVHSTPERTFAFPAGAEDREFELRLTRPGVVEVELHELGDVVVTIAAMP